MYSEKKKAKKKPMINPVERGVSKAVIRWFYQPLTKIHQ